MKKFENRAAAVARIWTAVSRLTPDAAKPAADVASDAAESNGHGAMANAKRPRRARTGTGPKPRAVFERVYKDSRTC